MIITEVAVSETVNFQVCFHCIRDREKPIPGYGDLTTWCRRFMREPFVIIEHTERMIAGGCFNFNPKWNANESHTPEPETRITYYELRCNEQDAMLFRSIWMQIE